MDKVNITISISNEYITNIRNPVEGRNITVALAAKTVDFANQTLSLEVYVQFILV